MRRGELGGPQTLRTSVGRHLLVSGPRRACSAWLHVHGPCSTSPRHCMGYKKRQSGCPARMAQSARAVMVVSVVTSLLPGLEVMQAHRAVKAKGHARTRSAVPPATLLLGSTGLPTPREGRCCRVAGDLAPNLGLLCRCQRLPAFVAACTGRVGTLVRAERLWLQFQARKVEETVNWQASGRGCA